MTSAVKLLPPRQHVRCKIVAGGEWLLAYDLGQGLYMIVDAPPVDSAFRRADVVRIQETPSGTPLASELVLRVLRWPVIK